MTRPRGPHQHTGLEIAADLRDPFSRGKGGPGGWWILPEPGSVFGDEREARIESFDAIALDIAGWWM